MINKKKKWSFNKWSTKLNTFTWNESNWSGATPQRREVLYPQSLTRTGAHEELLEDFGFQPPPIKANLMRSLELAAQEEESEGGVSDQVGIQV